MIGGPGRDRRKDWKAAVLLTSTSTCSVTPLGLAPLFHILSLLLHTPASL